MGRRGYARRPPGKIGVTARVALVQVNTRGRRKPSEPHGFKERKPFTT